MNDHELLKRYAEGGSNEAFAELVRRHLNLVYSAAQRQVRSAQIAEEVTQAVFFDLARCARKLNPTQPLAAWLFTVTRRTAIDALRRENRQRHRDQIAVEIADMKTPSPSWIQVEPLLDEAMASLNEKDRSAVLLRFFENKSLREIGEALGASDDAAQKRVTRAVEQLRTFFGKHGVAVSAAALTTDLSAQAVQSAPASMLAPLLTSTAAFTATTAAVSQILIMTTLKKLGLAVVAAGIVGVGIYELKDVLEGRETRQALQLRLDAVLAENRELRAQRDAAAAKLTATSSALAEAQALATSGDPEIESALEAWLDRVQEMKRWLEKMPDKRIPQMVLLTEDDWLAAAKDAKLDTEWGVREAIAELRGMALRRFSEPMSAAVGRYTKANNRQLPTSPEQLLPYFTPPVDPALLQNYEITEMTGVRAIDSDGSEPKFMISNKVVDDIYDARYGHTAGGSGIMQSMRISYDAVRDAVRGFRKANNGQSPASAAQLASYLQRPVEPAYVESLLSDVEKLK